MWGDMQVFEIALLCLTFTLPVNVRGPLIQTFLIRAIRLGALGIKLFLELGLQDQDDS